jgi:putative flippase GtrA
MLIQYLKFFVNGGVLGIAAWGLQWLIYKAINGNSAETYGVATALTYVPLVVVNFSIQRRWIFNRPGMFWRFVIANLMIMVLVSTMAALFRNMINLWLSPPWGERCGFIAAALLGSVPSFFLKKTWVFGARK